MMCVSAAVCIAAACAATPPRAAEYAGPEDYGLRSKSWRLDADAERLLADWGTNKYVRKAGRTDFFVRAQLKYGINRRDFLHPW